MWLKQEEVPEAKFWPSHAFQLAYSPFIWCSHLFMCINYTFTLLLLSLGGAYLTCFNNGDRKIFTRQQQYQKMWIRLLSSGVFSLRATIHHLLYSCLLEDLIACMIMSNQLRFITLTSNTTNQKVREPELLKLTRESDTLKFWMNSLGCWHKLFCLIYYWLLNINYQAAGASVVWVPVLWRKCAFC